MTDPYKILEIDRNASDEEVKKAYRKLSRKYHPDANINNPNKNEAEAKFKEVQQAYQQIMDERERGYSSSDSAYGQNGGYEEYGPFGGFGGFGSYGYGAGNGQNGRAETEEDVHLRAAANYIRSGHYKEALNVLDGIREHSALWYFYSASANSGLGNNVTALEHAKEAVRLDPQNLQYQMLQQRLEGGGTWYQNRQTMYGYPGTFDSNWCVKLCVANILCNLCCGGGGLCCGGYGGASGGGFTGGTPM